MAVVWPVPRTEVTPPPPHTHRSFHHPDTRDTGLTCSDGVTTCTYSFISETSIEATNGVSVSARGLPVSTNFPIFDIFS